MKRTSRLLIGAAAAVAFFACGPAANRLSADDHTATGPAENRFAVPAQNLVFERTIDGVSADDSANVQLVDHRHRYYGPRGGVSFSFGYGAPYGGYYSYGYSPRYYGYSYYRPRYYGYSYYSPDYYGYLGYGPPAWGYNYAPTYFYGGYSYYPRSYYYGPRVYGGYYGTWGYGSAWGY